MYTSFLPIPEMVTHSEFLRHALQYLGQGRLVRERLREALRNPDMSRGSPFVRGFSRLNWRPDGHNLRTSLHQLRLEGDYKVRCRPPIPLTATRSGQEDIGGSVLAVTEQVRILPTLFAEYRFRSTPFDTDHGDSEWPGGLIDRAQERIHDVKTSVSKVLFGNQASISTSFSGFFTIDIQVAESPSGGTRVSSHKYPATVAVEGNTVTVKTVPNASRLFVDRLTDGVTLALAQRVLLPSLWARIRTLDLTRAVTFRELVEALFLSNGPRYYTHSRKATPHLLPCAYQRRVFEVVSDSLGLIQLEEEIRKDFGDFMISVPIQRLLPLLDVSEPLRSEMAASLRRLTMRHELFELKAPLRTVFDYLTVANLRDSYLSETEPDIHFRPESKRGWRTGNQIMKGVRRMEDCCDIQQRLSQDMLYPIPGTVLQDLLRIGVIRADETAKTSARWVFAVGPDTDTAKRNMVDLRSRFTTSKMLELGK